MGLRPGLCARPVKFAHMNLGKPFLSGPGFVQGGSVMVKQKKGPTHAVGKLLAVYCFQVPKVGGNINFYSSSCFYPICRRVCVCVSVVACKLHVHRRSHLAACL